MGKTRLSVEVARRCRERYDVVWWLRAEDPLALLGDYAALADALLLPEAAERDQETQVHAVVDWCRQHGRWLLVFGNAPDPGAVRDLVPDGDGHVLVTSRRQPGWRTIAEPV